MAEHETVKKLLLTEICNSLNLEGFWLKRGKYYIWLNQGVIIVYLW